LWAAPSFPRCQTRARFSGPCIRSRPAVRVANRSSSNPRERAVGPLYTETIFRCQQSLRLDASTRKAAEGDRLLVDAVTLHLPLRERVFNRI
jgi:hypothetical protein